MRFDPRHWAREEADKPALVFDTGESLSYGGLDALADRFAQLFRAHGLTPGDHVAAMLHNDPRLIAAVWGAYRAGVYFTPVATTFSAAECAHVVRNCTARLFLADDRFAEAVAGIPAGIPALHGCLVTGGALPGFEDLDAALARQPATPIADETPGALMMYSSGTTGAPKGIWRPLPTRDEIAEAPPPFAADLIDIFDWHRETRYLSTQPLYHAAGLRFALATTAAGGTAHVMRKFEAGAALDLLVRHRITASQWVPAMFRRLLDLPEAERAAFAAPDHLRAIHGAAPISPTMKREMIDWWGPILIEYYSGTEGVGLSLIDSHDWLRHPGSVGRVVKGVGHVLDGDGTELPPGETGAIHFSGITPFAYFGDPEKTATRTSPQGYQSFGDIGRIDADGFMYLTDRMDDMIISGGVNLYPQEIEKALEEMPEVAECAVVGRKDARFGERPVGFVVRSPRSEGPEEAFLDRFHAFCRQRLGATKQLREVHLVASLPRSNAGKLLRKELKEPVPAGEGTA
ncbi:AMP-binding protein [Salipiger sp.]|uniref:AMP-binding protein n=1 Tax=Salipiger sp. TaxID=2078585 RepID=UPI003A982177